MSNPPTLEYLRHRASEILLARLRRRASDIVANRGTERVGVEPALNQSLPAPMPTVPQVIGIDLQPIAKVVGECVTVLAEIGQAVREIAAQVRERRSPSPRSIRVTHSDGSVSVVEQVSNAAVARADDEDAPLLPPMLGDR